MFLKKLLTSVGKLPQLKKMPVDKPFTIAVEGNIGSGKTTFLKHIQNLTQATVVAEPIELWRNCNGYNLLNLMYEDPHKWSFTFQSYVQLTMLQNHTLKTTSSFKLMERSLYSARYCFVEKMKNDGIMPAASFSVVDEWFKWICENQDVSLDLIVYLRTSPEVVYQRILNRNRPEERTVPFEYIKSLHEMHENWLYYKTLFECPAPVFTINADLDLSIMKEEYGKFESQVLNKKLSSLGV